MSILGWVSIALVGGVLAGAILIWLVILTSKDNLKLSQDLCELIAKAKVLGLPDQDIVNATEMLDYAEFGEVFEIVVVQLYEYSISVDAEYYQLIEALAEKLRLPEQRYAFVKKLIK